MAAQCKLTTPDSHPRSKGRCYPTKDWITCNNRYLWVRMVIWIHYQRRQGIIKWTDGKRQRTILADDKYSPRGILDLAWASMTKGFRTVSHLAKGQLVANPSLKALETEWTATGPSIWSKIKNKKKPWKGLKTCSTTWSLSIMKRWIMHSKTLKIWRTTR